MNIYKTFPDFDDFNKEDQGELRALFDGNSIITFEDLQKGIFGKGNDPFEGLRIEKTFQEITNEIALGSPFGKDSVFYKPKENTYRSYLEKKGKYNSIAKMFPNVDLEKIFTVEKTETFSNIKYK